MESPISSISPATRDEALAEGSDYRPRRPSRQDRDDSARLQELLVRALELGFTPDELGALLARSP
jgi:hypothetical protein